MKKTTPLSQAPQGGKTNAKSHAPALQALTPAVAQAVLEDALLGLAADHAARAAAPAEDDDILLAVIDPETPEEQELLELLRVPYLGETRVRALADIGIRTLADLHAASPDRIGGVKGVGMGNAARIKDWLATQTPSAPDTKTVDDKTPPVASSPDPALAVNNAVIFDSLGEIDALLIVLRGSLGNGGLSKRLERQFDKVSAVTSELAEGPDTLPQKNLQQAVRLLQRIVDALQEASKRKRLSDKKQDALAEQLRDGRKALQKVLGE